jgi:hypothetical protein
MQATMATMPTIIAAQSSFLMGGVPNKPWEWGSVTWGTLYDNRVSDNQASLGKEIDEDEPGPSKPATGKWQQKWQPKWAHV